jgi:hypothetical protein
VARGLFFSAGNLSILTTDDPLLIQVDKDYAEALEMMTHE